MTKKDVISALLGLFRKPRYLEVNVRGVGISDEVEAQTKRLTPSLACPENQTVPKGDDLYNQKFDVIFLNGVNNFDLTLREFTSSLALLDENGLVVIDNVLPNCMEASMPSWTDAHSLSGMTRRTGASWMGDVYKLVFLIEAFFPSLTYRNVAESHGMLVVWRRKREVDEGVRVEDVKQVGYPELLLNKHIFNDAPLSDVIGDFGESVFSKGTANDALSLDTLKSYAQIERSCNKPRSTEISPHVMRLEGACVIPFALHEYLFHGGVEKDVHCPYASFSGVNRRDVQIKRPRTVSRKRGVYLYAGPVWSHFGHMITEGVHRLWAYDPLKYDGVVFNCMKGVSEPVPEEISKNYWKPWGDVNFPGFLEEIMGVMGVDAPVVLVQKPTVFDVLDVPEPGSVLGVGVSPFYEDALRSYQTRVADLVKELDVPEKIYFSRRHILGSNGGVLGVSCFEKLLNENGFQVVKPETQPLLQQFANVLKAKEIAFDDGSSVHTTELFGELQPRFYLFPRRPFLSHCAPALTTRKARLDVLSPLDNVALLPDFQGNISECAIGFYKNVDVVIETMARCGLDVSSFDKAEFERMEEEELASCTVTTQSVRSERLAILRDARKK